MDPGGRAAAAPGLDSTAVARRRIRSSQQIHLRAACGGAEVAAGGVVHGGVWRATSLGAAPPEAAGKETLAAMCSPALPMRFFLRSSEQREQESF